MKLTIQDIIDNNTYREIGRRAVENALIELRDNRISQPMRRNGLVVFEKDSTPSSLIRLGMEDAITIALKAILEFAQSEEKDLTPDP